MTNAGVRKDCYESSDHLEGVSSGASILAFPSSFAGKGTPAGRLPKDLSVERTLEAIRPCLEHVLWERESTQAFESLARRIVSDVNPETPMEMEFTAKLIVAFWRVYRIEKIEVATLTKGEGNVHRVVGEFMKQNRSWHAAMLGAQRILQVIERSQTMRRKERGENKMMDHYSLI